MSVNTEGTTAASTDGTPLPEGTPRQHVEAGEISNGGLDLPEGEKKSDTQEAERDQHHEWHPDSDKQ